MGLKEYLQSKKLIWSKATYLSTQSRLRQVIAVSPELNPAKLFNTFKKKGQGLYTIKQTLIVAGVFETETRHTSTIKNWLTKNAFVFRNCYKEKTQFITQAQYDQLLSEAETSPGLYNMLVLMGEAGLRKSEALNASWSDFTNNVLTVIGKGGKLRHVPLLQSKLRTVVGESTVNTPICGSRNGCHYFFQKKPLTFHDLRAFFATKLVNTPGISLRDAQILLGHASIRTTQRYLRSDFNRVKSILIGEVA